MAHSPHQFQCSVLRFSVQCSEKSNKNFHTQHPTFFSSYLNHLDQTCASLRSHSRIQICSYRSWRLFGQLVKAIFSRGCIKTCLDHSCFSFFSLSKWKCVNMETCDYELKSTLRGWVNFIIANRTFKNLLRIDKRKFHPSP